MLTPNGATRIKDVIVSYLEAQRDAPKVEEHGAWVKAEKVCTDLASNASPSSTAGKIDFGRDLVESMIDELIKEGRIEARTDDYRVRYVRAFPI